MKVVVNIPAFNEEESIGYIIESIPEIEGCELTVVVVDDGSKDLTGQISKEKGAIVVRNAHNLGLGKTLKIGLNAALELDADIIVNIDADGQYNPKDIPALIKPILDGKADLVMANRFNKMKYKMPRIKKWGNKFVSWWVRFLTGLEIQDSQTGFRAISRTLAETLQVLLKGTYTYTQEMLIHAKFNGFIVVEKNFDFNERKSGKSRLISNSFAYLFKVAKIVIGTYKDYKPMNFFAMVAFIFVMIGLMALGLDAQGELTGLHLIPKIEISNDPKILATILIPVAIAFFLILFGFTMDIINRTRTSLIRENVQLKESVNKLNKKMDKLLNLNEKKESK